SAALRAALKAFDQRLAALHALDPDSAHQDEARVWDSFHRWVEETVSVLYDLGLNEDAPRFRRTIQVNGVPAKAIAAAEFLHRLGIQLKQDPQIIERAANKRPRSRMTPQSAPAAKKIFIGHGGSITWHQLRDFIHDRLGLETEEYNSISTAGLARTERLNEML